MSVSSIEPIMEDVSKSLNRTESFNDLVLEEAKKKRMKDQLIYLKRGVFAGFIINAILIIISIYSITTLHHVQITIKSHDEILKDTQEKISDYKGAREDLQKRANSEMEKLKVNMNAQLSIANKNFEDFNDAKNEIKINDYKITSLENRIEQILLTGILRSSSEHKQTISTALNKGDNLNNSPNNSCTQNHGLILQLNDTLISRVDEMALEMQDMHQKIQQNSNQLNHISTNSKAKPMNSLSNGSFESEHPSNQTNERKLIMDVQLMVNDMRDSLNKLRFGRRGK